MAKETVRYPDTLVSRIEAFVDDSTAFESKSEYHRFASEFLLSLLEPEHEPSVLGYGEIYDDLGDLDGVLAGSADDAEPFLEAYIRVRRHLLHDEPEAARAVVDERYDVTDREALLLDELIGRSRGVDRHPSAAGGPSGYTGDAEASDPTNGSVRDGETGETTDSDSDRGEQRTDSPSQPVEESPVGPER